MVQSIFATNLMISVLCGVRTRCLMLPYTLCRSVGDVKRCVYYMNKKKGKEKAAQHTFISSTSIILCDRNASFVTMQSFCCWIIFLNRRYESYVQYRNIAHKRNVNGQKDAEENFIPAITVIFLKQKLHYRMTNITHIV